MSWMAPVSADMGSLRCLAAQCLLAPGLLVWGLLVSGLLVSEQLLDPAAPLLQPVERQAEIGDRVADRVVRAVVFEPDQQGPLVRAGLRAPPPRPRQPYPGAPCRPHRPTLPPL